jgi:hypothetical protein
MPTIRDAVALIAAIITAFALAATFYTQQVLSKQEAFGAVYAAGQELQIYLYNFAGLAPSYGAGLAVALLIGFFVAVRVKRVLPALAPIAYPVAGAAAMFTLLWAIDNSSGAGGVGAIGGARDALGVGLQMLAGAAGGLVFEWQRPRRQL